MDNLFTLSSTKKISYTALRSLLPTVEVALFFARAYRLDWPQLNDLLRLLFPKEVILELLAGSHSTELQDYLIDTVPPSTRDQIVMDFVDQPAPGEFLPQLWESLEIQIAASIKEVADKLVDVVSLFPGKAGQMSMAHLMQLNKQRPTLGLYKAQITHARHAPNLVILDVSGSMSEYTVRAIIEDVVALSWKADAHLAIVSNHAYHWEPGSYDVKHVLAQAEFQGTHYETLTDLLNRDWGVVVTIADYDSALAAKTWIRDNARGTIQEVLDISLVDRPTFLSECVGQKAKNVRQLLVGNSRSVLR